MESLPINKTGLGRMLSRFMEYGILFLSISAVLIITVYVVTRYFFKINFPGYEEIMFFIIFWLYFLGSACGSRDQSHIAGGILGSFVNSERAMVISRIFIALICTAVSALSLWLSVDFLLFNAKLGATTPNFGLPLYLTHAALVVGFGLMLLYEACYLVYYIQELRRLSAAPAAEDKEANN